MKIKTQSVVDTAHYFLSQRVSIIPVTKDKKPYAGFSWDAYKKRFPTQDEIDIWFRYVYPNANLAIVTGALSKLIILDIDPRNGGDISLLKNNKSPSVSTPNNGKHIYFRPTNLVKSAKHSALGYDLLYEALALVPPSLTVNGAYEWINSFNRNNIEEFPKYLLSKLEPIQPKQNEASAKPLSQKKGNQKTQLRGIEVRHARDYPLDRLLLSDGVNLIQRTNSYHLTCPFHSDRKSSAVYYPSTNLVYCFKCSRAFNPIDYLTIAKGYSFREALKELTE